MRKILGTFLVGFLVAVGLMQYLSFKRDLRTGVNPSLTAQSSDVASATESIQSPSIEQDTDAPTIEDEENVQPDDLDVKVVRLQSLGKTLGSPKIYSVEALGTWKAVTLQVTNRGTSTKTFDFTRITLKDANGSTYEVSTDGTGAYSAIVRNELIPWQLPPSITARYYLLFDVTPGARNFKVVVKPDIGAIAR